MDGLCPMTYQKKLFDLNLIKTFLAILAKKIYSYANLNKIKFYEDLTNTNDRFF